MRSQLRVAAGGGAPATEVVSAGEPMLIQTEGPDTRALSGLDPPRVAVAPAATAPQRMRGRLPALLGLQVMVGCGK